MTRPIPASSVAEEGFRGFWYAYEGEPVAEERSRFQHVAVYRTATFGMMLVLDGLVQTTEADEFCYHEMLTHVPLLTHPDPKRVLIIGGGDGGTLRHVLMHPGVDRAVMCEIDEVVTRLCRAHLPSLAGDALDDPRAEVLFADGIAYVRDGGDPFDVIIIDSSDPVGPGEGLFTPAFYRDAAARLSPDGIIVAQSGSVLFQQEELRTTVAGMSQALDDVRTYTGVVPTYPGTLWSYTMGARALRVDGAAAAARATERALATRYWSPALHEACFALPRFALDLLAGDDVPEGWLERARALPGR